MGGTASWLGPCGLPFEPMATEGDGTASRPLSAKPKSARATAAGARAWGVTQQLRSRRGWFLDEAHLSRSWSVRIGEVAFELSAYVSFWFEDGGFVLQLTPTFRKGTRRKTVEAVLQSLGAAFGERYRVNAISKSIWTKLRTDDPKQVLSEIANVERALGTRAVAARGGTPRSQDGRRWMIVNSMRAKSWKLASVTFSRWVGDRTQRIWPSIAVIVDSATGRSGLAAHFAAWTHEPNERWTRFIDDAALRLTADGFKFHEKESRSIHAGKWMPGLSGARALKQAEAFEQLVGGGADLVPAASA